MFSCERRALARAFRALGLCSTWPRKHRPCRALATWTPENTAPAMLWPLGRSKGLLEAPLGAPGALEWAARAPTWCPPKRSKGLHHPPLDAPRALEGAARAPAQCPEGALRGCASLLGAPGGSKWVLKPLLGTPLAFRTPFCPPAWCCRWALAPDARGGVWKCCSKNLFSATPALCDTLLCHTLLRAWICTGSH